VDVVGTGGDGSNSFNVSTAAAFVAAGAGLTVAKHNNRAMTSRCGSADVLEALGIKIDLDAGQVEACLKQVGIGFMFAPGFHPATKFAVAPRREIGIRTVFNILGPLTNPALAEYQVIGVATAALGETIVRVLDRLGSKHSLVVHGLSGMDELSLEGPSQIWELREGQINGYQVSALDFGLSAAGMEAVRGGEPAANAARLRSVLQGETGPDRDVVLMNAAAAMVVGGLTRNSHGLPALRDGLEIARESIDSGKALRKLGSLITVSQNI
jgi:anthranilate phosphoribosyltransferase